MYIIASKSDELSISEALAQLLRHRSSEEGVLVFVGEEHKDEIERIHSNVRKALEGASDTVIPFIGGIFPRVIYAGTSSVEGIVFSTCPAIGTPFVVEGLNTPDFRIPEVPHEENLHSIVVFTDGLTSNISGLLSKLYDHFGNNVQYIGGGAGSLTLQQQKCVFTREGIWQDAAVCMPSPRSLTIGVSHGWERLLGPYVVSRSEKNIVLELNWQPALEIYKEMLKEQTGEEATAENFFGLAKGYPFGLVKEGEEDIVRDPIAITEEGIVCVGEVPEQSVVYILKGTPENLIQAAGDAATAASSDTAQQALVIDCISRVLYLDRRYDEEIQAVLEALPDNLPLGGALTLGEISSLGDRYLEFFNKTIVVGCVNGK